MKGLTKGGVNERAEKARAQAERKLRRQWETDADRIDAENERLRAERENLINSLHARRGVPAAQSEPGSASEIYKSKLGPRQESSSAAAGPGGKRNSRRKSRKQRKSRKSRKQRKSHKRNRRH